MNKFIEDMENMYTRSAMAESVILPGQQANQIARVILDINAVIENKSGAFSAIKDIKRILSSTPSS